MKRWKVLRSDEQKTAKLREALKVNSILCGILVQRGYETYEQAKDFFRPQLADLYSPWLMKDMYKAVDRILAAFTNQEKILVSEIMT